MVAIESNTRGRSGTPELDDWLAGDGGFDWPDEPMHDAEAVGSDRPEDGSSHPFEPIRRSPASEEARRRPDAATFVRRRRILGVSALGLFIATAVAIALATTGGRSGKAAPASATTNAAETATQPVTPPPTRSQPSASTATKPKTTSTASATSLRVSLPSNESLAAEDSGQAVVKLQKALAMLGYDVTADGKFGTATEEAVKAFQKANGLTADGVAGSATVQKLNEALAER